MIERKRRFAAVLTLLVVVGVMLFQGVQPSPSDSIEQPADTTTPPSVQGDSTRAIDVLSTLPVKGRAPRTDYAREQFGADWAEIEGCDMRNIILQRDLTDIKLAEDGCIVLSGSLDDPYTGKTIPFQRGTTSSSEVQIDHVVALSDAWQKGAQGLDVADRATFANDPLNLLAVDGPTNQKKGDGDAATWLPPNNAYRCRFVARQIAVKQTYDLWITQAEHDAMQRVLATCPDQVLPLQIIPDISNVQPQEQS